MTPEQALREAIDHTRFLADHLEGRMGDGALADMRMKADEWEGAIGRPSEAEARAERAEAALRKKTRECEIRKQANDKWVPCPDHRDKVSGECQVCLRERAETALAEESDRADSLMRRLEALATPSGESVQEQECWHWGSGRSVGDCMADGDCHEGCPQAKAINAPQQPEGDMELPGLWESADFSGGETDAQQPAEHGDDALAALDRLIVDDYERDEKGNADERPQDIALIRRHLAANPVPYVPSEEAQQNIDRALEQLLPDLRFGRETHRQWMEHLRACPNDAASESVGDDKFHETMVETYDLRITTIERAISDLRQRSPYVPEQIRRLPEKLKHDEQSLWRQGGKRERQMAEGMRRTIKQLERALASAPAVPDGWQPIETAPKDGTFVLVYEGSTTRRMWRAQWDESIGWMFGATSDDHIACAFFRVAPTHWMPLPAEPQHGGE